MKVLQVNVVYKKGSTGKIVYDIHTELQKKGIQSVVCYGRGTTIKEKNIYKTSSELLAKVNALRSRITGLQYNGSWLATNKLVKIIKKEKPDIVHLHCINGYFVNIYSLLNFLKKNNINTVLTLHAEFMYTGGCGNALNCEKWKNKNGCSNCPLLKEATNSYFFDRTNTSWKMMKKSFAEFNNLIVVSVSPWVMNRAKQSIILSGKEHVTVLNGIDTATTFKLKEFEDLKNNLNIKDEKILLHVTASFTSDFKGGRYIIELAKRLSKNNIKIIVIGNKNKNLDLPKNIIDIGVISNQNELAMYYSLADLSVITSRQETFSMVCAESLSCGTPVVGFKAGAPEHISLSDYSEFVENGNIDSLETVVRKWISKEDVDKEEISKIGRKVYAKENMLDGYIEVYNKFIN